MALPSLAVNEIPAEGMELDHRVHPEDLEVDSDDVRACGELALQVHILPAGDEFVVRGVFSGKVLRQCVRCLSDYQDAVDLSVHALYREQKGKAGRPPARTKSSSQDLPEETVSEDEVYTYTGDHIDLAPMLREQVILATPMHPVCREDCQGLCPTCGQDRNITRCGCPAEQRPSPFMALRELWNKPNDSSNQS